MAHLLLAVTTRSSPYVRFRHIATKHLGPIHVSETCMCHIPHHGFYRQRPCLIHAKQRTGSFLEQRRQKMQSSRMLPPFDPSPHRRCCYLVGPRHHQATAEAELAHDSGMDKFVRQDRSRTSRMLQRVSFGLRHSVCCSVAPEVLALQHLSRHHTCRQQMP